MVGGPEHLPAAAGGGGEATLAGPPVTKEISWSHLQARIVHRAASDSGTKLPPPMLFWMVSGISLHTLRSSSIGRADAHLLPRELNLISQGISLL